MPILNFETLDLVPEGLREFATPVEGQEGKVKVNVVAETKLSSFRDTNINLLKERDEYRSKFEPLHAIVGDDPETFTKTLAEYQAMAQRVKDGDLKETRSVEEALSRRTEELRKSMELQIQAEAKEKNAWRLKHEALETQFKHSQVSSYLKDAVLASDSGVLPQTAADLVDIGLKVFKMGTDGRIVPYEGDAPIYGSDGSSPMTAKEWVQKQKEVRSNFFQGTQGGGSGPHGSLTEKRVLGRTTADLKKMSAAERLAVANGDDSVPRR